MPKYSFSCLPCLIRAAASVILRVTKVSPRRSLSWLKRIPEQQKQIRHDLRVDYEFNISDFNEPGKAFGEEELQAAIKRGAIQILDDATIEAMKAKRARDKARDEAEKQKEAVASGEQTDWKEAMKEWKEYYER